MCIRCWNSLPHHHRGHYNPITTWPLWFVFDTSLSLLTPLQLLTTLGLGSLVTPLIYFIWVYQYLFSHLVLHLILFFCNFLVLYCFLIVHPVNWVIDYPILNIFIWPHQLCWSSGYYKILYINSNTETQCTDGFTSWKQCPKTS